MLKFTNEEKKKACKSMQLCCDDLWAILEKSPLTDLTICVNVHDKFKLETHYFNLALKKDKILVYDAVTMKPSRLCLATCMCGHKKYTTDVNSKICLYFIGNYDNIRKEVVSEIARKEDNRDVFLRMVNDINAHYDKEAEIELDFPETSNLNEIEITREDGKNVATIDCGDRTIKIVTNGGFVVVDKSKEKVKVLKKSNV